ncbi:hypothetical protein HK101_005435, partial [Irineochytrium annulatum]
MLLTLASALVALSSAVSALPNGAPKCQIIPAAIQKGHGVAETTTLGYALAASSMTYTPGGPPMAIM